MANQEQLEILKQGVDVWNKWRIKNRTVEVNLNNVDLSNTNLCNVYFAHSNLKGGNLNYTNLTNAIIRDADLEKASLVGANLTNTLISDSNLGEIDFGKADFRNADFTGSDLSKSIFMGAKFKNTTFYKAYLCDTDFRTARINRSDFSKADLTGADFTEASLFESHFVRTILQNAIFNYTKLALTTFSHIDLSKVKGLENIQHITGSYIGTSTVQLSKGKIPVEFFRGCGLSDLEIEQAKLATPGLHPEQITDITYKIHELYLGEGIQYYSCFISYNSDNQEFAQKLYNDLQENGVRCWFAPEDMKIGDQIRPTIDKQIRVRDKLLVILSENSVKSEWVGDEVEAALEEEKTSDRLVLFPIRLDEAVMETRDDWAAKIKRRRHIGDFSNWKDEGSYQKAFERLLRDLKAGSDG